jgi:small-conductance mechanosensitive channel
MGRCKTDIILAIVTTFKENGIEIPFPQQDLHIRSVNNSEVENKNEMV